MEKSNVVISGICPRRDRFNQLLAGKCGENNFAYHIIILILGCILIEMVST